MACCVMPLSTRDDATSQQDKLEKALEVEEALAAEKCKLLEQREKENGQHQRERSAFKVIVCVKLCACVCGV